MWMFENSKNHRIMGFDVSKNIEYSKNNSSQWWLAFVHFPIPEIYTFDTGLPSVEKW